MPRLLRCLSPQLAVHIPTHIHTHVQMGSSTSLTKGQPVFAIAASSIRGWGLSSETTKQGKGGVPIAPSLDTALGSASGPGEAIRPAAGEEVRPTAGEAVRPAAGGDANTSDVPTSKAATNRSAVNEFHIHMRSKLPFWIALNECVPLPLSALSLAKVWLTAKDPGSHFQPQPSLGWGSPRRPLTEKVHCATPFRSGQRRILKVCASRAPGTVYRSTLLLHYDCRSRLI